MSPSIEDTIVRVEQLYTAITGRQPPHINGSTRIPPEIDPGRHVEEQLGRLLLTIEDKLASAEATPAVWQPRAIVWQDETGFELALDVPGATRDSIEVSCDGNLLVVRGQRQAPWGEQVCTPVTSETPLGAFARTFALPVQVEPSQISARLDSGVLRVRVARRPQPERQPIAVHS